MRCTALPSSAPNAKNDKKPGTGSLDAQQEVRGRSRARRRRRCRGASTRSPTARDAERGADRGRSLLRRCRRTSTLADVEVDTLAGEVGEVEPEVVEHRRPAAAISSKNSFSQSAPVPNALVTTRTTQVPPDAPRRGTR